MILQNQQTLEVDIKKAEKDGKTLDFWIVTVTTVRRNTDLAKEPVWNQPFDMFVKYIIYFGSAGNQQPLRYCRRAFINSMVLF